MGNLTDTILTAPQILNRIPLSYPLPIFDSAKLVNSVPPSQIITEELIMLEGQTTKTTPRSGRQQLHLEKSKSIPVIDFYGIGINADAPLKQEDPMTYVNRIGAPKLEKDAIFQDIERDLIASIEAAKVAGTILSHDPGAGVFIGYTDLQKLAYLAERLRLIQANGGILPDTLVVPSGYEPYLTNILSYSISAGSASISISAARNYPEVEKLLSGLKVEFVKSWTGNVGKNRTAGTPTTELGYDMYLIASKSAQIVAPNDTQTNPVPALTVYMWGMETGLVPKGLKNYDYETELYSSVHISDPRSIYVVEDAFEPAP